MDENIRTIWCGNLHDKVTEDILYELFMQGGPVQRVSIPRDRDGKQKSFGFVTYKHECSVPYALDLFDGTTLFNRTLNMKSRNNPMENYYMQQQQQQYRQGNSCDLKQQNIQNELQLGQQILLGAMSPLAFANNSLSMIPGYNSYPSQNYYYSQSPQNSSDCGRNNRQQNRNHPYHDRGQSDHRRNNDHQDSFSRDHKSYKHSSHRSNRHENRRKYH